MKSRFKVGDLVYNHPYFEEHKKLQCGIVVETCEKFPMTIFWFNLERKIRYSKEEWWIKRMEKQ